MEASHGLFLGTHLSPPCCISFIVFEIFPICGFKNSTNPPGATQHKRAGGAGEWKAQGGGDLNP